MKNQDRFMEEVKEAVSQPARRDVCAGCFCVGCEWEMEECYTWQNVSGCVAGLEFDSGHVSFFVIDEKTGDFIVPFYYRSRNARRKI